MEVRGAVLVTGGASGIGAGMIDALIEANLAVGVADKNFEGALAEAERHQKLGRPVEAIELDVTSPESCERALLDMESRGYFVQGLVNCAGMNRRSPALGVSPGDWDAILDVNLKGTFFMCQAFAARLIAADRPGAIVNITSMLAHYGARNLVAYASSKGGVAMLTRCLAVEWAPHNIRVNAVSPGYLETAQTARMLALPRYKETLLQRTPLGRLGTVGDVANVVVFLLSDAAGFVTGHMIPVDGGIVAGEPAMSPPADAIRPSVEAAPQGARGVD